MRRLCVHPAYKSLSGAGFEVSDSAVYACELREPFDILGSKEMDARDKRTMRRGESNLHYRMFRTPEEAVAGKHTLSVDENVEAEK
jgi:hypothetical protein